MDGKKRTLGRELATWLAAFHFHPRNRSLPYLEYAQVRLAKLRPVGLKEEKLEDARARARAKVDAIKARLGF